MLSATALYDSTPIIPSPWFHPLLTFDAQTRLGYVFYIPSFDH